MMSDIQNEQQFHNGDTFEGEGTASMNFAEDKWDQFFQNNDATKNKKDDKSDDDEQMHTMPSFREGAEDDCEKTLSVIYDDTDLARDHLQNFTYQDQYVTQNPRDTVQSPGYAKSPTSSFNC